MADLREPSAPAAYRGADGHRERGVRGSGRGTAMGRALLLALLCAASLAATTGPPPAADGDGDEAASVDRVASLAVEQRAVVGTLPEDGDLEPGEPLPTLRFDPTRLGPLDAVHEVAVTNTGTLALRRIVITDDRLGTLALADPDVVLAPGGRLVVRASEPFVFADAAGRLPSLLERTSVVTATAADDTPVTGAATSAFEMVAVLEPVELAVELAVVPDSGDVQLTADGTPELVWSAEQRLDGAARQLRVLATVRNVGAGDVADLVLDLDPTAGTARRAPQPGEAADDRPVVLASGADHTVAFDVVVEASALSADLAVGAAGSTVLGITVAASGTDTTGLVDGAAQDATEVRLRVRAPELPAAGATVTGLGAVALLLLVLGAVALAGAAGGGRAEVGVDRP